MRVLRVLCGAEVLVLSEHESRNLVIREENGKHCLYTHDGKKKLGCHDSKKGAVDQEQAINVSKNKHKMSAYSRHMKAAREGDVKTTQYQGREHLVVPVIALVEGVIHASNAEAPELVTAEEFEKNVDRWNGRPVMFDHPVIEGTPVSANDPRVLDQFQIGDVFNARVENLKLKMDAYIDPARLEGMGEAGQKMLAGLRAGETLEVSVGTMVVATPENGKMGGQPYSAVWRDISSDHLAFLPAGVAGACSVEMGCGTRAAGGQGSDNFGHGGRPGEVGGSGGGGGKSEKLGKPGEDVSMKEGTRVILAPFTDDDGTEVPAQRGKLWDAYVKGDQAAQVKIDKRDQTELDREENGVREVPIEQITRVLSENDDTARAAGCGCGGQGSHNASAEEGSMSKKERIAALIASGKTCFKTADAAALEQLSDEAITILENPPKTEVPKAPTPDEFLAANPDIKAIVDASKADAVLTAEQRQEAFFKANPDIATVVKEHKAAAAAKRADLVGKLKVAQQAYNETELQALPTEQLEKIALLTLKEKPSYEGAGAPRDASAGSEETVSAPPSLSSHFRAAKKPAA